MTFKEIVMARYATKSFDGQTVPQGKVDELKEIIRYAPTSFNVQPWRVKVIADAERREALKEAAWNQPQIMSCSHLFIFCANTDLDGLVDRLEAQALESGLPKDKVDGFIGMIRNFSKGLDAPARLAWSQRQTYLALANGLNGAKSLGFDSCPMEGFEPDAFARILQLSENLVPTVLMTIGFANDTPRPKLRFRTQEMFFEAKE